jgi:hypothetical protein
MAELLTTDSNGFQSVEAEFRTIAGNRAPYLLAK